MGYIKVLIFEFFPLYFQVCPVCAKRVGMDIVSHITMQHGSFFKISFFMLLVSLFLMFSMFCLLFELICIG